MRSTSSSNVAGNGPGGDRRPGVRTADGPAESGPRRGRQVRALVAVASKRAGDAEKQSKPGLTGWQMNI